MNWDSETRSLYYDEQESEVGHLGFSVREGAGSALGCARVPAPSAAAFQVTGA